MRHDPGAATRLTEVGLPPSYPMLSIPVEGKRIYRADTVWAISFLYKIRRKRDFRLWGIDP
jgi:hypothetical protein